jgi:colanic acid/amylovoran biosynthesis protein
VIVNIRGLHLGNKGDDLMLIAAAAEVRAWAGVTTVAVPARVAPWLGRSLQVRRARALGLSLLLRNRAWEGKGFEALLGAIPRAVRRRLGILSEPEVDVFLDASGFGYGDVWGDAATDRLALLSTRLSARGKPVVLLPQAFGPFSTPKRRDAMRTILSNAKLVFARDTASLAHLNAMAVPGANIHLAPDFTNLVPGTPMPDVDLGPDPVAIVPNTRMLDKADGSTAGAYRRFLDVMVKELIRRGRRPFVLVHDWDDTALAASVASLATPPLTVLAEQDSQRLKGILGRCTLVIASRYHALVGALSQGVPVLATGWTHKYAGLLSDYGCPESMIRMDEDPAVAVRRSLDMVLAPGSAAALGLRLKASADAQRDRANAMWAMVRSTCGVTLRVS